MEKKRQIDHESISRNVTRQEWYAAFVPHQDTNRKSESKDKNRQREFPKLVAVHQRNDPWSELSAGELDDKQYRGGTNNDQCERSEEHTSELQSRLHLVCRLLLEKKNNHKTRKNTLSDGTKCT